MTIDSQNFTPNQRLKYIVSTLYDFRMLWLVPAIAGLLLSVFYVMFLKGETWSAHQSLIVRDDLSGQSFKPGRFESQESMKAAQETILEISRKPQVIRKALEKLGPASVGIFGNGSWPSEQVIEEMQGNITLSASNGSELGKTEVIVLNVKSSTRERSREFINLLLDEIAIKTNEVRKLRLQSMVTELKQARDASWKVLEESKTRLRQMDKTFGGDLGALGSYEDRGGSGILERDISQIELEKRSVEADIESATKVLEMLVQARQNPQRIINTSSDLIKYQPSLEALKGGLVEAQRELTVRIGKYTPDHPAVKGARDSIVAMKTTIYNELASSIVGLKQDISSLRLKTNRLDSEIALLNGRLSRVSSGRVDSMTLLSEVKKRTELANNAESDLQEIRALASSTSPVDLITLVDEPQVPTRPDGMGKKEMVLAGAVGGLMLGLGLVMLLAPPIGETEERQPSPRSTTTASARAESPSASTSPERKIPETRERPPVVAPPLADPTERASVPKQPFVNSLVPPKNPLTPRSEPAKSKPAIQPIANSPAVQPVQPRSAPVAPKQPAQPTRVTPPAPQPVQASQDYQTTASSSASQIASSASKWAEAPVAAIASKELQTLEQQAENALNSVKEKSGVATIVRQAEQTMVMESQPARSEPQVPKKAATVAAAPTAGVRQPDITCELVDQAFEEELTRTREPNIKDKQEDLINKILANEAGGQSELEQAANQDGEPVPRRVNPFLRNRDAESADQPPLEKDSTSPVPDQIKKLSAAISTFAKPINRADPKNTQGF